MSGVTMQAPSAASPSTSAGPHARLAGLHAAYLEVRQATQALCSGLSAEDCALQSMPDASPVKWHLAHTSWFFETFVLERALPGYRPFHPRFRVLYNSYYVGVGERHPRPERGLLSRPSLEDIRAYRRHVDAHVAKWVERGRADESALAVFELGLHHEQQHQELIVTDLKHLLSRNPLRPTYVPGQPAVAVHPRAAQWIAFPAGLREIGHGGAGFCFDNEQPRHRVYLDAFRHAFARLSGARLPTEAERETAAAACALSGNFAESRRFAPVPSPAVDGLQQMFGDVWEWTASAYLGYPGYQPAAGAVGEYNGKFMVNQFVLRGGSCATPHSHIRAIYRNFFPPAARWQFSGIRLAANEA
jgi:formylglycine-generating enzyme required for sulfatase activity